MTSLPQPSLLAALYPQACCLNWLTNLVTALQYPCIYYTFNSATMTSTTILQPCNNNDAATMSHTVNNHVIINHSATTMSQCNNHVTTMQQPCHNATTMQQQQQPCSNNATTISQPCSKYVETM